MIQFKKLSWMGIVMAFMCQHAVADDVYTFVVKKQEVKTQHRWNLIDWLAMRDTMRIQDLWLSLHSPSPYEYFIGSTYQFNQAAQSGNFNYWEIYGGAFSSVLGLEAHYESAPTSRFHAMLDFRFIGHHDQSTNLTLQAGLLQTTSPSDTYRNAILGLRMTLYLTKFFGVEGLYRRYFPSTPTASGGFFMGDRWEGGGFIDFSFCRLYGDYVSDAGGGPPYTGVTLGAKLYL